MNKNLTSSEWLLSAGLLAILASLVAVGKINSSMAFSQIETHSVEQARFTPLSVEGAVARPGSYRHELGAPLAETVLKAKPTRFADLKSLSLEETSERSLIIKVKELTEIEVLIVGAVLNPGPLRLPAGSRLCDLKSKIQCSKEADRSLFKRRRLLKDGEIVEIPQSEANNG